MKRMFIWMSMVAGLASCQSKPQNSESYYLDLNTGDSLNLRADTASGAMVDAQTGKPVGLYVDTRTKDTLYGPTHTVVNGRVERDDHGQWVVKGEGDEFKAKAEDGTKVKVEGEESKVKSGSYTRKVEKDGDVKIETGSRTIKIDGKTGERKVKKDHNITDKVKKILH